MPTDQIVDKEADAAEQFGIHVAMGAKLLVDQQLFLERPAGDDIDRAGQRFRRDQAGPGAARNVDPFDVAEADAVEAVGRGHRREDGNAVDEQRGVAAGQIVEYHIADIADRTFGLH